MTETSGSYTSDSDLTDTSDDELYTASSDDDYEYVRKEITDSDETYTDDDTDTSMTSSELSDETDLSKNKRPNINKSDDFADEDEIILVTSSERELQEARIMAVKEALKESTRKSVQWVEKITQRRMYALSDYKTLQRMRNERRMKFYDDVKSFVKKNKVASNKDKSVKTVKK